jgi:ERCC4-related helicase
VDVSIKKEKDMNIEDYIKGLKKSSKEDDIPGTVESILEELCPSCSKKMRMYKPCCGSPKGYKGCQSCGYKIQLT